MEHSTAKTPERLAERTATPMQQDAPSSVATHRTSIVVARFQLSAIVAPPVVYTVPLAEKLRRALISHRVDTSHSFALSGKHPDGKPLRDHEHAFYLLTDEDKDGRIDHATLWAAGGFDPYDLQAIGSLRTLFGANSPSIGVCLKALGDVRDTLDLPVFRAARVWQSVTPFCLPRFSTRGLGKGPRPRDLPEGQLRRELRLRGMPDPVRATPMRGYEHREGCVEWENFIAQRRDGSYGNGVAGFEIEFPEPVAGPITVGFGCHFGLGLFLPVRENDDVSDHH